MLWAPENVRPPTHMWGVMDLSRVFSGGCMMKFNENYNFFEVIDLSLWLINIIHILQINS